MRKLVCILVSLFIFALPAFSHGYHELIRVGISTNNFKRLYYSSISIGGQKTYTVYNKATGEDLIDMSPYKWLRITMTDGKFNLFSGGNLIKKGIKGPIGIKSNGLLRVRNLKRKGKSALYRGEFELTKAFTKPTRFNLINILPLSDYLKGVVPNEIPVRFGLEAVKAQTVAARNYTLRPRVKVYHNFDVCDTVQSQVYFGANTEQEIANQAINSTKGIFALYKGDVILALYSSTAGGHTENFENAFTSPDCNSFPSNPLPYLRGKPDIPLSGKKLVLSEDKYAEMFYSSSPNSFDAHSKYYRWERSWTRKELESTLRKTLKSYSGTGFISPKFTSPEQLGTIKSVRVTSRGVSGKAIAIEVRTSKGVFEIKKELIIRRVFKKVMKSLPSANIVVKSKYSEDGNLENITFIGGGFGHGVGLSQYGAGAMAHMGYSFDKILQHYYSGIALGTFPIDLCDKSLKVNFVSPNKEAYLHIENNENVDEFSFKINSIEINLDKNFLLKKNRLKLSKYIEDDNIIEFSPLTNGKKMKVWVEVFEAK